MANPISDGQDRIIAGFLEHCQQETYTAKQLIIRAGEPSNDLYYIVSGSVSVVIEDHEGHEILLAYLNVGDFFGESGLFDLNSRRSAFARAKSKSDIARISYDKLKKLHNLFPDLLFLIASQMAIRLRRTSRKVSDLVFLDVKGRVARTLLDLSKEPDAITHPRGMQIQITRQELSRIAGCSRKMVPRILKNLEEDHLVSVSGKTMVIFGTR